MEIPYAAALRMAKWNIHFIFPKINPHASGTYKALYNSQSIKITKELYTSLPFIISKLPRAEQ